MILSRESIILNDIHYEFNEKGEDSLLIISTPHTCYSHAIIEYFFSYFCVLEDIKNIFPTINPTLLIRKKEFDLYPDNYKNVDIEQNIYKGIYYELMRIITNKPILFEHNIKEINYKHLFIYPDINQRTLWNSSKYYPNRENINIIYDDLYFKKKILSFRDTIYSRYNIIPINSKKHKMLFIDRISTVGRKIDDNIKKQILYYGDEYNCNLVYLDGLPFEEQVKLFSQYNIFIYIHGSAATNLIFAPLGSICFELDTEHNRGMIYKRICDLLEHTHYVINYDKNMNIYEDIIKKI